jgi:Na+/melibiose symporter-like transporter
MKSKGLGILLILIFGPIGLFYSSIVGGIIMTLTMPVLFLIILAKGSDSFFILLLLFTPIFYIICFIWSYRSISKQNKVDSNNSLNRQVEPGNFSHSSYRQDSPEELNYYEKYRQDVDGKRNNPLSGLIFLLIFFIAICLAVYYKTDILSFFK